MNLEWTFLRGISLQHLVWQDACVLLLQTRVTFAAIPVFAVHAWYTLVLFPCLNSRYDTGVQPSKQASVVLFLSEVYSRYIKISGQLET